MFCVDVANSLMFVAAIEDHLIRKDERRNRVTVLQLRSVLVLKRHQLRHANDYQRTNREKSGRQSFSATAAITFSHPALPKPEPYVLVQTGSIWTAMPADEDL